LADSRIMVAVSTPWASEKLVGVVEDLARRLDAAVVVTHVARPTEQDESDSDVRRRAEQTLRTLTERLREGGIPCESVLLFGDDVARALLNAAEAHDATMLCLGLSGKGRMARLLEGDVPARVVRTAQIPVLLFPPDWSGMI